jgi:16S rRNA (adenine1518-N6/adenine1519-N6)-dimethyltransferase
MNNIYVKPKKHLGQHFLEDMSIAQRIGDALTFHGDYKRVLEIGPGTGALTQFLISKTEYLTEVVEVDRESVQYLHQVYPDLKVYEENFLKMDFSKFEGEPLAVIGNFPYNISSQILFKVLDEKDSVPEVVGMFQKEVAERVAIGPGSKVYGILSVLLQAFYDIEYLFTVDEHVFNPPPKVKSGVIRLKRNNVKQLECDEKLFKTVVKAAFNQRRKTVRNSIKGLLQGKEIESEFLSERPEQMSVADFIKLTNSIESALKE